jgi:urease accessory protein
VPAADTKSRPADAAAEQASLVFARAPDGRTFIARQRVGYPFHITRPFYLDRAPAGLLTLYLQSVSGGIYQDDRLAMRLHAEADAQAQVTTQAATIVHTMPRGEAAQSLAIRAEAGAYLEYWPDPLILFPDARLASALDVVVDERATVLLCDAFTQHDPAAAGRRFAWLKGESRISRPNGRLLALDRFAISGDRVQEQARAGQGDYPAQATVMAIHGAGPADALVDALRQGLGEIDGLYAGASALPAGCGAWARLLAPDGLILRAGLDAAWASLRRCITGAEPGVRRK